MISWPAARPGILNVSLYRLADYLDQHGRRQRTDQIPPAGFWAAAADHAFPGDQATLGDAAAARGLYRAAAQLHKNAAACGNLRAVRYLSNPLHCLRGDVRPVRWAIAHVAIEDPGAVAELLIRLQGAGAEEQVTALLCRDPAAHVALDNPRSVGRLLDSLRKAGAEEQVTALADRAAAHVALNDPSAVTALGRLRGGAPAGRSSRRPRPPQRPGRPGRRRQATGGGRGGAGRRAGRATVRALPRARGPPQPVPVRPGS